MDHNFKLAFQSWSGLYWPNPNSSFHSDNAEVTPSTNITGVADAYIDSLAYIYDNEYDHDKRVELIRLIDRRLTELVPYALAWYGPFNRVVYWNKFGYPDGFLSRTGDWLAIQSLWYIDPEREKAMNEAIADPSKTLPTGETNDTYWLEKLGKM